MIVQYALRTHAFLRLTSTVVSDNILNANEEAFLAVVLEIFPELSAFNRFLDLGRLDVVFF